MNGTTQHLAVIGITCAAASAARSQCELGWLNDFGHAVTMQGDPPAPIPPEADEVTRVGAMAVYDPDGDGPEPPRLIVGGRFTHVGGIQANAIAAWDGSQWSALGGGLDAMYSYSRVADLLVDDDDGDGPARPLLYVAGVGLRAIGSGEGEPFRPVLKWDGRTWSSVGDGEIGRVVSSLAFFDDGSGLMLYAASNDGYAFTRLENGAWRLVIPGSPSRPLIQKMIRTEVEGKPALALLGGYPFIGSDGQTLALSAVAWVGPLTDPNSVDGVRFMEYGISGEVNAAMNFDPDGPGNASEELYVGGRISAAYHTSDPEDFDRARHLARWDGSRWHGLEPESPTGMALREITALTVFDDGTGPAIIAGLSCGNRLFGVFEVPTWGIVKLVGNRWEPVGLPFGHLNVFASANQDREITNDRCPVHALACFADSDGQSTPFAGGQFQFADGQFVGHLARLARPFVRGDVNGDGTVDMKDVAGVLEDWLAEYRYERTGPGDANSDSRVTFADVAEVLERFGASCP